MCWAGGAGAGNNTCPEALCELNSMYTALGETELSPCALLANDGQKAGHLKRLRHMSSLASGEHIGVIEHQRSPLTCTDQVMQKSGVTIHYSHLHCCRGENV